MNAGMTFVRGGDLRPGLGGAGELSDIETLVFFLESGERAKVEVFSLNKGE
jgi:hypothetical protein